MLFKYIKRKYGFLESVKNWTNVSERIQKSTNVQITPKIEYKRIFFMDILENAFIKHHYLSINSSFSSFKLFKFKCKYYREGNKMFSFLPHFGHECIFYLNPPCFLQHTSMVSKYFTKEKNSENSVCLWCHRIFWTERILTYAPDVWVPSK